MRHVGMDADARTPPLPRPDRGRRRPVDALAVAAAAIAVLFGALSCGDSGTEPGSQSSVATSVLVSPAATALTALGEVLQLTAEVRDQHGQVMTGGTVLWTSSDPSVAVVDGSGRVTAAGNGGATITAAAGPASAAAAVTVAQVVSAVAVTPPADTLLAFGDTVRLAAEATDANGYAVAGSGFAWASSDTLVARVDGSGRVTAAGNGGATITAAAGPASGAAAVTVAQAVTAVAVTPSADTLVAFGDTARLAAEATDANGYAVAGSGFAWASSDTLVARVDGSGLVESFAEGAAVVTATTSEVTGAADLRIVGTACTRGEVGYFELRDPDGRRDCIPIASPPTITYLDGAGNPVPDRSSITDHRIKVSFGERVSYITSDRHEALTPSFARRMIELIGANDTNTPGGVFGFEVDVGLDDGRSYFILIPNASYPPGQYSVRVKNYVVTEEAAKVLKSVNTDSYLSFINNEYSSFSTPEIDVLCDSEASGYFQLAYDYGRRDCVKIPQVVFTFTPRGGPEMIESNFDPTAVIKIYFDSEVVYLSDSGQWRNISSYNLLDMIEISGKASWYGDDVVSNDGGIGVSLISVSHAGGATTITIKPPYDPRTRTGEVYKNHQPYNLMVRRFARRADVSKISRSNSLTSYLADTETFYHGDFGARYYTATSCDLEARPMGATHGDKMGSGDVVVTDDLVYEPDMVWDPPLSASEYPASWRAIQTSDDGDVRLERADPGTRYVVDVAFIIADPVYSNASGDWRGYLEKVVLKDIDKIYQNSGVNVEFRPSDISPFSDYRDELLCDLPAIENLGLKGSELSGLGYVALRELVPSVRKRNPADIVVLINPGGGGHAASGSFKNHYADSRSQSWAIARVHSRFFDINRHDVWNRKSNAIVLSNLLAHELGHVFGLHHDVNTLLAYGNNISKMIDYYSSIGPIGFGFGGRHSKEPIGTIMSYARDDQHVPICADKQMLISELCGKIEGIQENIGFCGGDASYPDRLIRIGGPQDHGVTADASEALQYTIGYVSEFSDAGIAPLNLFTVSNAVTAKTLRAKR